MASSSASQAFVHLHTHSSYSLSEGAIKADKLAVLARDAGMPAVALTDTANLFGALEFSQACAAKGVQPIMGCQLWLGREHLEARGGAAGCDPERNAPDPVVALAMDARGLDNLQRLSSLGFLNSDQSGRPCLRLDTLAGARGRPVPAHRRHPRPGVAPAFGGPARGRRRSCSPRCARPSPTASRSSCTATASRWSVRSSRRCSTLADELGLPIVAANDVYFAKPEMHEAHDALLCIAEGRLLAEPNRRRVTPEHWFKPAERHARALRRPAGGLRQHPRHRPELRGDDGSAQARAAALPQGAARHDGSRDGARHGAPRPRRADGRRRRRRPPRASPTRSGWTTSSASSRAWASPATS